MKRQKQRMRVWIMALAAVLLTAVTACENAAGGGTAAGVDSSLVGTWVSYDSGYEIVVEFGADGSFSSSDYSIAPMASSTWSADGSTVTARIEANVGGQQLTISRNTDDSITIENLLQTGTGESFEDIPIKLPRKSGTGDTGVWEYSIADISNNEMSITLILDTGSFTFEMLNKSLFYSQTVSASGSRSGNNLDVNKAVQIMDMDYEINGSNLMLYYFGEPLTFSKQQ